MFLLAYVFRIVFKIPLYHKNIFSDIFVVTLSKFKPLIIKFFNVSVSLLWLGSFFFQNFRLSLLFPYEYFWHLNRFITNSTLQRDNCFYKFSMLQNYTCFHYVEVSLCAMFTQVQILLSSVFIKQWSQYMVGI